MASGFKGASIASTSEQEPTLPPTFDAGQYSFFGNFDATDDPFEESLEEGIDAPPEEDFALGDESALPDDVLLETEEDVDKGDLSFASMFDSSLRVDDEGQDHAVFSRVPQPPGLPVSAAASLRLFDHGGLAQSPIDNTGPLYGLSSPVAAMLVQQPMALSTVADHQGTPTSPGCGSLLSSVHGTPPGRYSDFPAQPAPRIISRAITAEELEQQLLMQDSPYPQAQPPAAAAQSPKHLPPSPYPTIAYPHPVPHPANIHSQHPGSQYAPRAGAPLTPQQGPVPTPGYNLTPPIPTPGYNPNPPIPTPGYNPNPPTFMRPPQQLRPPRPVPFPIPGHSLARGPMPGHYLGTSPLRQVPSPHPPSPLAHLPPGPPGPYGSPVPSPHPGQIGRFPSPQHHRLPHPGYPYGRVSSPMQGAPPHFPDGHHLPPGAVRPPQFLPGPHAMHPPGPRGRWSPQQQRREPHDVVSGYIAARGFHGSAYMDADEIENILRIQWKSLHSSSPYMEDYYYQAFVNKHFNKRNFRFFAPDGIRDLAPTEKIGPGEISYVKLEGLGKIAFSNIRRPKPLMETSNKDFDRRATESSQSTEASTKPLEQEPLLAARIMIEDCMCLLLDVDDIDRMFAATDGPKDCDAVARQRRLLLMEGLAASMRLQESPAAYTNGRAASESGSDPGDGVFLRLMVLHKGRTLLARALRVLYPPPETGVTSVNLRLMWAFLRNVRLIFGSGAKRTQGKPSFKGATATDAALTPEDVEVASSIASSAVDVAQKLNSASAVTDCMTALVSGDLCNHVDDSPEAALAPFLPAGAKLQDDDLRMWLADIIIALLQQASEFGLSSSTAQAAAVSTWRDVFVKLFDVLIRHVELVHSTFQAVRSQTPELIEQVRALVPVNLIRATLPHSNEQQRDRLRGLLHELS